MPATPARPLPRLPVFGWNTFAGPRRPAIPCILDAPGLSFTTSGRISILHALKALAIGDGDAVLVPTYHCPTMIAPIVAVHATPICFPLTAAGAADLGALDRLATPQTRAILAAHYFGLPQPMAALRAWCDARRIALIEDCAHALFGLSDGRAIGSWGDLAIASLTKFLPVPEGGCLVDNRRPPGPPPSLKSRGALPQLKAALDIAEEGVKYRQLAGLNALLGAVFALKRTLRRQPQPAIAPPPARAVDDDSFYGIDHSLADNKLTLASRWIAEHAQLDRIVDQRRRNYRRLAEIFAGRPGLRPLRPELPEHAAPYVFPLWVATPDPGYQRLRGEAIPLFRWDHLWPGTPTIAGDHGIEWSHHVFQLPCHQDLRPGEIDLIATAVHRALESQPRTAQ